MCTAAPAALSQGRELSGNLLNVAYDEARQGSLVLVVQGCNCFGFGGGLSAQIGESFPEAKLVDQETTLGDKSKLGTYSSVDVKRNGVTFKIVNAYTQYREGEEKQLDLQKNIRKVFRQINKDFPRHKIFYPAIGCGNTGGDWNKIQLIIRSVLRYRDFTFVRHNPDEKVILPQNNDVITAFQKTDTSTSNKEPTRKDVDGGVKIEDQPWHQTLTAKVLCVAGALKAIAVITLAIYHEFKKKGAIDPEKALDPTPIGL